MQNNSSARQELIKDMIRNVPDFPEKGIMFRDITSLLIEPLGINALSAEVYYQLYDHNILHCNKIVAIESRGFIIGSVATEQFDDVGLVLARKPGKLPREVLQKKYKLEYGEGAICIHTSDIKEGDNVIVVDDVLATGGTALTACEIVEALGGTVEACYFLIELDGLKGRELIERKGIKVISSVHY